MDKYEFNIKYDQIKKFASKKDYKSASKIAKEMDWRKVKDWTTLATIVNVHEAAGDLEETRDIAILAYNRNLGGRKLVYKLTELFIRLKQFDDAEDLYDEYARMSQHDVNKYALLYNLKKAEGVTTSELVEILEEYKDHELDEKYLYELAILYSKTGKTDKCVQQCEQIILWFQDGNYVEKAIRLKQKYSTITAAQKKVLDAAKNQQDANLDETKEILFEEQKEKARLEEDEIEDVFREDAVKHGEIAEEDEKSEISGTIKEVKTDRSQMISPANSDIAKATGPIVDLVQNEVDEKVMNAFKALIQKAMGTNQVESQMEEPNAVVLNKSETKISLAEDMPNAEQTQKGIERAGESLRELIENAKKKIESNYEQVRREDAEESLQEAVTNNGVPIANYNLYDAQNIQQELAKNLGELMMDDEYSDLFKPSRVQEEQPIVQKEVAATSTEEVSEEDEQIEGQLNLSDWIQAVKEKKYGEQNTKEFSKAELEKMLEERESDKEAYEKLLAKQKEIATANGEPYDEEEARSKANTELMIQSAKTDLAIRTGKATAKLEATLEHLREAVEIVSRIQENDIDVELEETATIEESTEYDSNADYAENDNQQEVEAFSEDEDEMDVSEDADESEASYEEYEEYEESLQIPKNVKKYFKKYSDMAGLEEQLARYFAESSEEIGMNTSEIGNIIISGNRSSDKTNLAVSMVKALNTLYPENAKKIAKTTGESINHKGLAKAISKLKGTALIVEDAGVIEPRRINEILNVLEQDTDGMIVIFEDADTEINVLISVNPDIQGKFNHRIVLKQYTVNELVEMAKKYAGKRQHDIDDNALLQLYLKIDKLHSQTECVRLDQIKEIIDKAIVRAEKRASRKFFGAIKKRRGQNGDVFFLIEADFKD